MNMPALLRPLATELLTRDSLHNYQNRIVEFIKDVPCCMCNVDMGLGKTAAAATAACDLLDTGEVRRVLIVAPLRVALFVWLQEFAKWEHLRDRSITLIRGTPAKRKAQALDGAEFHVINKELLPWLVDNVPWQWDMVIVDESSGFKSHSTKRFKSFRTIRDYISRVVCLTGTPTSNGLLDLWAQIYLLDKGQRLGRHFTRFRDIYFRPIDPNRWSWVIRANAEQKIHEAVKDICIAMRAEDYLELPERINNYVEVHLPQPARDAYEDLRVNLVLQLTEDKKVAAFNPAVLTGKLQQLTSGAMYKDEEGTYVPIHDAKLDALEEIRDSHAGEPLLVFIHFKSDKERIMKRFKDAEYLGKDQSTVDRWCSGEIPMLLLHPASAGHGLNLQSGGRIAVWFTLPWSLENYQQANARLHRQGQRDRVIIHHLVADRTVDAAVLRALDGKLKTQEDLLEALRA